MKGKEAKTFEEEVQAAGDPGLREPRRGHSTLFAADDDAAAPVAAAAAAAASLSIIDSHPLPSPAVAMQARSTLVSNANAHTHGLNLPQLSRLPSYSRPPELHLPPGVAPFEEFLSMFSSVSAVALTLLGTSIPLQATTAEEEKTIDQALLNYALCATTVMLFWFKMQTSLEHSVILLFFDQIMLGLWLLALVLLPVFLGRIIGWRSRFDASLLILDYCLLAAVNLGFDASLCWHKHHRAMVYPRGQAARRRRLRNAAISFAGVMLLGLLGLCLDTFLHIYVLLMPLVLLAEQAYDMYEATWYRCHKDRDGLVAPDALYRPREALGPVAESADLSTSSSDEESDGGTALSNSASASLPPPLDPPSFVGASSILPSSIGSFILAPRFRRHRTPRASEQPPPPRAAARMPLPLWYALRVKRVEEVKDLFSSVTGAALTLLSVILPSLDDGNHVKQFRTGLFMYFWAALAVLLYYKRMRQLLSFRRFLFLPEIVLASMWMILIVLIPTFMDAVALYGRGHGVVGKWTTAESNNTRLLVIHVLLDATATLFALSLFYWERKVGPSYAREKAMGPSGASTERGGSGFSLLKMLIVEASKLCFSTILLGCQVMIDGFSNQYVYIIPSSLLIVETYLHFYGGASK